MFADRFCMNGDMWVAMPRNSCSSSASAGFVILRMSSIRAGSEWTPFALNTNEELQLTRVDFALIAVEDKAGHDYVPPASADGGWRYVPLRYTRKPLHHL